MNANGNNNNNNNNTNVNANMKSIECDDYDDVVESSNASPLQQLVKSVTGTTPAKSAATSMTTYSLSERRFVDVTGKSIIVCDESTRKFINFSVQRWVKLRDVAGYIDDAIERILKRKPDVFYQRHLGATWFVTVQSGVWCVDIRKHVNIPLVATYQSSIGGGGGGGKMVVIDSVGPDNDSDYSSGGGDDKNNRDDIDGINLRPTSVGLGLRIREWRTLKEVMAIVDSIRPDILQAQPCYLTHQSQDGKRLLLLQHQQQQQQQQHYTFAYCCFHYCYHYYYYYY